MTNVIDIGELVKKDEIIAYIGEIPIKATISGLLRGLLRDGSTVTEGFKIADIDPRVEENNNVLGVIILNKIIDLHKIKTTAESYYRNGDFFCSEAIVKTIKDEFGLSISDDVIAMASGFPVGIGGSGCTCGAVVGGVMAIGLFFGRTEPKDTKITKVMVLSKELHDTFKDKHKFLCCSVLTKGMTLGSEEHMEQCIYFTGEVAEEAAKIIIRELNLKIK